MRVGVYENKPKIFTGKNCKPSGIFIDIIEYIAQHEGWNLKYVPGTWSDGLERLEKREIDLMPDVAYTTERAKKFTFHKIPVLLSWSQVYARKGSKIQSLLNLDRKRVAVLEGSVQQATFSKFIGGFGLHVTLIPVKDYGTMFDIITGGKADAGITNRFYGLIHAKELNLEDTGIIFDPSDLFFAAPADAPQQLMETIDRYVEKLKNDSQSIYFVSLKHWTSEDIKFIFPLWLQVLGVAMVIIILTTLTGSVILKYQVNMRTMELMRINQQMEERIMERTAELERANKELESFSYNVSHDLRAPLRHICGFIEMLKKEIGETGSPRINHFIEVITNSSKRMSQLIEDLLSFSRMKRTSFSSQSVNMEVIVDNVLDEFSEEIKKRGIFISRKELQNINGDPAMFRVVFVNLISNAIKFTAKTTGPVIEIGSDIYGSTKVFYVRDNGAGFNMKYSDKLFGVFQRLHNEQDFEGTGIGLAMVKNIIERHNGRVRAESEPDKGACFYFYLPVDENG